MKKRKIDNDCERATFLIEKKQVDTITLADAVDLDTHLADCLECRVFQLQSEVINILCRKVLGEYNGSSLDNNFRQALQSRIDTELRKD